MPEPTAEAWAQIRHDYEHTDRQIVDICAAHGITSPMLRYRVKRWGWTKRRSLVPRQGPPPVEVVPQEIAATPAVAAPPPHPAPAIYAAAPIADLPPLSADVIILRLQGAIARVLPAIDTTIARLAASQHPREMEQAGRTLSSLTRTLRELNELLVEQEKARSEEEPEMDPDEFRRDLARRLHGIIEAEKAREMEAERAREAQQNVIHAP